MTDLQRLEDIRHDAQFAAIKDGHEFVGTDKQVEWARSIRGTVAGDLARFVAARPDMPNREIVDSLIVTILGQASAAWWIDHRSMTAMEILSEAYTASQAV